MTIIRSARRIVTGHDENGNAVVLSDGPTPVAINNESIGVDLFEIWNTSASPAPLNAKERDPTDREMTVEPPKKGTIIRIVDFHPGQSFAPNGASNIAIAEGFGKMGSPGASTAKSDSPHPLMHRTETVDYGVVLEGRMTLVLDRDERDLVAGDVVVQRGTNHAWDNRSDAICRMAFILVDGAFQEDLSRVLSQH